MLHGSVEYELQLILLNLLGILAMTSHTAFFQLDIIQTGKVSLHTFELDWTFNNNEIWDNVELKSTNFGLSMPSHNMFGVVLVVLLYQIEEQF